MAFGRKSPVKMAKTSTSASYANVLLIGMKYIRSQGVNVDAKKGLNMDCVLHDAASGEKNLVKSSLQQPNFPSENFSSTHKEHRKKS